MNLNSIIRKVKKETKVIVSQRCSEMFDVICYGSVHIDAGLLVILIAVRTDEIKSRLALDSEMNSLIRESLVRNGYPASAIDNVIIWVESQETVDRESHGDWHIHRS